jgi:hypothetical protein
MKHGKIFLGFLVLIGTAVLFLGCPTEPEDEPNYGGEEKTLAIEVASGAVKYYSLTSGLEVTDPAAIASKAWDIAFQESRKIYTNSGATAESLTSGGIGGVWHTEKKTLEGVTQDDAVKDDPLYGPYNTDVIRYTGGMSGTPTANRLNVMTFVGYSNEDTNDGSQDLPFSSSYQYDKRQFYDMVSMQPLQIDPTLWVYIIKHGDGEHYSKIQVTTYERASPKDTYLITYSNF